MANSGLKSGGKSHPIFHRFSVLTTFDRQSVPRKGKTRDRRAQSRVARSRAGPEYARHDVSGCGRGVRERRHDLGGHRGEGGREGDVPQVRWKSASGQPRAREAVRHMRDPIPRLGLRQPPGTGGVPQSGPPVSQGACFLVHRTRAPAPAPVFEPHSRHARANELHRAKHDRRAVHVPGRFLAC